MSTEQLVALLGLIAVVIVVASLLSGLVDRTGLPQVAIFLLLGLALGPYALGLVDFALDSAAIQVVASLALLLVLFSDAVDVDIGELRRNRGLALLVLVPGTLIPAALLTVAGTLLLGLPVAAAAALGGALASTDPVLLRHLLRHPAVTGRARLALRMESGMNDVVLLPVVVLAMMLLPHAAGEHERSVGSRIVGLFVLGPALGAAVGWMAIRVLEAVRTRVGVRRDYESLYALGVALGAFAAAEAVGGSGFLAAFFAGLMVALLDVELCDCFLDFGQATSEMFLLLTFVAFGTSVIWTGFEVANVRTLGYAAIALVVRTFVLLPVLARSEMSTRDRQVVALFGPRGLSSLLLILLPVFGGVEGAPQMFAVTALVVLMSVVLHGAMIAWFLRRSGGPAAAAAPEPQQLVSEPTPHADREADAAAATTSGGSTPPERITPDELRALRAAGDEVILVDTRTERSRASDPRDAPGAIRMLPDGAVRDARAQRLSQRATLVVFCA